MTLPNPLTTKFVGQDVNGRCTVCVTSDGETRALPFYFSVRRHSPTGFGWGYCGSGPAQLALALCITLVGKHRALRVYQHVKAQLVVMLNHSYWELQGTEVMNTIEDAEAMTV